MRNKLKLAILSAALIVVAAAGSRAQTPKAGLWDLTTRTTLKRPGGTDGHVAISGENSPNGEAATLPVCYTSALIERYGLALPPSLRDCELLNIARKPGSFRADVSCKGTYNGRGSVETTWTDEDHAEGKVHFTSKSRSAHPLSLPWTQDVTAVFRAEDCGNVKPRPVPAKTIAH